MDNDLFLLIASYGSIFYEVPHIYAHAPGRVNLIGEHTDYNEGFVLPMAIEERMHVVARPMYGDLVRVKSVGYDEIEEFQIKDIQADNLSKTGAWSDYVKGMAREFTNQGDGLNGFWALYRSDVPVGSGLSSSAALEIATAMLMAEMFGYKIGPEDMAKMARRAEEEFVGIRCGVMDQMTSLMAKEGHAMFIDCRDMSYEHIPIKFANAAFVVVDTKVKRDLGSSVYNDRRRECEEAAVAIKATKPDVKTLRDATIDDLGKIKIDETIMKRARHIISENERVIKAKGYLKDGELTKFGDLMYLSHESLKDDYEVSSPELDLVVKIAQGLDGVFGARMTGAGFGGCAVALVKKNAIEIFTGAIKGAFEERELEEPDIFEVAPSRGAGVERLDQQK